MTDCALTLEQQELTASGIQESIGEKWEVNMHSLSSNKGKPSFIYLKPRIINGNMDRITGLSKASPYLGKVNVDLGLENLFDPWKKAVMHAGDLVPELQTRGSDGDCGYSRVYERHACLYRDLNAHCRSQLLPRTE